MILSVQLEKIGPRWYVLWSEGDGRTLPALKQERLEARTQDEARNEAASRLGVSIKSVQLWEV